MTFAAWLNEAQKRIWTEERAVLQRALDVLSGWETVPVDVEDLRRALQQLDELFLLVVVGEFNTGKSSLINALLGEAFLPEWPTPTTDRVYVAWPRRSGGSRVRSGRRAIGALSRRAPAEAAHRRHARDERDPAPARGHRPRPRPAQ